MSLVVTDEAFPYLVLQQGALDGLKGDRAAWEAAYREKMGTLFAAMAPHLPVPSRRERILDIGGGMGGIDLLLARHYGDTEISIVDGAADPPEMVRHAQTFNDLSVTREFLAANGQTDFVPRPADNPGRPAPYDIVLSFGSWCFHYEPEAYLDFVKACCRPGTRLILEVRRGKPSWLGALIDAFGKAELISRHGKFDRLKFVAG